MGLSRVVSGQWSRVCACVCVARLISRGREVGFKDNVTKLMGTATGGTGVSESMS